MYRYFYRSVMVCMAIACLSGCSTLVNPFNSSAYSNNDSQTDITDTTDDVPYAIGQYLDQIKADHDSQTFVPVTQQKLAVHKQDRNTSSPD